MHIGLLSDPNNFHTRKWARALESAGAKVTVFSFNSLIGEGPYTVTLSAPLSLGNRFTYLSYLKGGKLLADTLTAHQVDVVNALNVTPFGVWAMQSHVRPMIVSALGADILEYPPAGTPLPHPPQRGWSMGDPKLNFFSRWKEKQKRSFYRRKVLAVLQQADLITGDNQYLVDKIREWFGIDADKCRLLHWGVEEELFQANAAQLQAVREKFNLAPGQRVILSPRGAKALYQADVILDSFEMLLRQGATAHKWIMLSAGYEIAPSVLAKAEKLMKEFPSFQFVKEVLPREVVYALWNFVDVFISAPVYDGYSATVAEGRYIGAIPVVNDIPANREVITSGVNGIIVNEFTASHLTKEIQAVLNDIPYWKNKFAPANREWILNHSLVKVNAEKFIQWCQELIPKK